MKKIGAEVVVFCSLLIALSGCGGANADTTNVLNAGVAKDINLISLASGTTVVSYQNISSEVLINAPSYPLWTRTPVNRSFSSVSLFR